MYVISKNHQFERVNIKIHNQHLIDQKHIVVNGFGHSKHLKILCEGPVCIKALEVI